MTRRSALTLALAPLVAPLAGLVQSTEDSYAWISDSPEQGFRPIAQDDFRSAMERALWLAYFYPDGTPRPSDAGQLFTVKRVAQDEEA